jgi:hypothetical protein
MKGGWLHNEVLMKPVESLFLTNGATTRREFPVNLADGPGLPSVCPTTWPRRWRFVRTGS